MSTRSGLMADRPQNQHPPDGRRGSLAARRVLADPATRAVWVWRMTRRQRERRARERRHKEARWMPS